MVPPQTAKAQIWVDGDALPREVRAILVRASERRGVQIHFAANRIPHGLSSRMITTYTVPVSDDAADDLIAERCGPGDLVVTADIPLAARAIEKQALVLQPRGRYLDEESIAESLSFRDFSEQLRSAGIETGGPRPMAGKDVTAFANALDRWLTKAGY